jgi:hypothetical protein
MIRNTDKRYAGDVPAAANGKAETAVGTFDSCRAWDSLPFTRRIPETAPGEEGTCAISNKLNTFAFVKL